MTTNKNNNKKSQKSLESKEQFFNLVWEYVIASLCFQIEPNIQHWMANEPNMFNAQKKRWQKEMRARGIARKRWTISKYQLITDVLVQLFRFPSRHIFARYIVRFLFVIFFLFSISIHPFQDMCVQSVGKYWFITWNCYLCNTNKLKSPFFSTCSSKTTTVYSIYTFVYGSVRFGDGISRIQQISYYNFLARIRYCIYVLCVFHYLSSIFPRIFDVRVAMLFKYLQYTGVQIALIQ